MQNNERMLLTSHFINARYHPTYRPKKVLTLFYIPNIMCIMLCTQHAVSHWINLEYIITFWGIDQDDRQGHCALLPVSLQNHHNTAWNKNSLSSASDGKEAQKVCEMLNSLGQLNGKAHMWPSTRSYDSTSNTQSNTTVGPNCGKLHRNFPQYLILLTSLPRRLILMI